MGNVFDFDLPPSPQIVEKVKRSKKREPMEALSTLEIAGGKRKLAEMVDRAFATLEEAMSNADHNTAIKAAQIILDRAGFGPKSTVDVNSVSLDLSALSREELAERASRVAGVLRGQKAAIDVTAIPVIETVN